MNKKPIDDNEVLNSFYDNRETFIVDFNPKLVKIEAFKDEVIFRLRSK